MKEYGAKKRIFTLAPIIDCTNSVTILICTNNPLHRLRNATVIIERTESGRCGAPAKS